MHNEEDPRFRQLKRKIAAFAAVAIAAIAAVLLLIGTESDLFTKKYDLVLTVDKGTGFSRGMPVKLSGFRIGRVKSISLNEAATVDIVLQIDRKYRKWIRKDSKAKLVKEGLVGDSIVEVSVGTPRAEELRDQERLSYQKTKALDEIADEISEKVKPVLSEVGAIIGYLNDPRGDIKQSLRNFNILSKNLELTRKRADLLLARTGEQVGSVSGQLSGAVGETSAQLSGVLKETSATLRVADSSLVQLKERLPALLDSADRSLRNVEAISRDLKQAEEQSLPKLPGLVQQSEEALRSTNEVVRAVGGIWPIKGRIPAPGENKFVPGDSHE